MIEKEEFSDFKITGFNFIKYLDYWKELESGSLRKNK